MTSDVTGDQKEYKVRKILEQQFNISDPQLMKSLGESFTKGTFSTENLSKMMNEVAKEQQKARDAVKNAPKVQAELLETGKSVAHGLQTLQDLLRQWVQDNVIKAISNLKQSIEELTAALSFLTGGATTKGMKAATTQLANQSAGDIAANARSGAANALGRKDTSLSGLMDLVTGKQSSVQQDTAFKYLNMMHKATPKMQQKMLENPMTGEYLKTEKKHRAVKRS